MSAGVLTSFPTSLVAFIANIRYDLIIIRRYKNASLFEQRKEAYNMSVQELELITPDENERPVLKKMEGVLNSKKSLSTKPPSLPLPKLVAPNGDSIELPLSIFRVLQRVVHYMIIGKAFSVVPYDQLLSTQEAADMLNISRPFLIKLLEAGALPFTKVGTHRRLQYSDLIIYKKHRDEERKKALAEMARMSEDLGIY
jgi:excisionase family DNA binding protein